MSEPYRTPCQIVLTRGHVALVDDDDYVRLSRFKWYALVKVRRNSVRICAVRDVMQPDGTRKSIYMHREIAGALDDEQIDHRDGNALNNQRANLRRCTNAQNSANKRVVMSTSGFKGVSRTKQRWRANIRVNFYQIHLGSFPTPEEAARAYDCAAIKYFGEFAATNASLGLLRTIHMGVAA